MEADTQLVFDRAADKREDLDYLEEQLVQPETLLLPFWRGDVFTHTDALVLVARKDAETVLDRAAEVVWLGLYGGRPCFAVDISPLPAPHELTCLQGSSPTQLRALLARLPASQIELSLFARALLLWHDRNRFCSVCGHANQPRRGGHVRICARSGCLSDHFPRTDPCVLVLICDGDSCLLARSKGWPAGMYSALAGFVEPGESLEQAVVREVLEEVGVEVDDLRYAGSQPWPFPASLMVGFVAKARTRQIRVDTNELEAARWVTRAELQAPEAHGFFVPPPFAIAGRLIAAFTAGTLQPFAT